MSNDSGWRCSDATLSAGRSELENKMFNICHVLNPTAKCSIEKNAKHLENGYTPRGDIVNVTISSFL